jgi:hypothetical protein
MTVTSVTTRMELDTAEQIRKSRPERKRRQKSFVLFAFVWESSLFKPTWPLKCVMTSAVEEIRVLWYLLGLVSLYLAVWLYFTWSRIGTVFKNTAPQNVKNYPSVDMKTEIPGFWRIRPCTLVCRFQLFGEVRSVCLQNNPRGLQQALSKRRSIYNNLDGVTHQKTGRFFCNDVSTPSLAEQINF